VFDQLGGCIRLEMNAGVGKDRTVSNADEVPTGEPGFIAGDLDVSHHSRHKIKNVPRSAVYAPSPGARHQDPRVIMAL
jgi:hypothetical protein